MRNLINIFLIIFFIVNQVIGSSQIYSQLNSLKSDEPVTENLTPDEKLAAELKIKNFEDTLHNSNNKIKMFSYLRQRKYNILTSIYL